MTKTDNISLIKTFNNWLGRNSFYRAVVDTDAWYEWEKHAYKKGFDWAESTECGLLSKEHFEAFLKWYKNKKI